MDRVRSEQRGVSIASLPMCLAAATLAVGLGGCRSTGVNVSVEKIAASEIPREFSKVSMPAHVVEPPDILLVEVLEALPGRPISGERLVRPDGTITLGFYGDIYVAGLTLDEVKEKIVLHLRNFLNDEVLGLYRSNPETGEPEPVKPADSDRVFVDVVAYNSKYYYVQGDVAAPGRLPITGNETVLDAIQFAGGLLPTASPNDVRLVRPAPPGACCEQVLPVSITSIIYDGDPSTNYQLLPGDRVVVMRDPSVRVTAFLERVTTPINYVLNTALTGAFAIQQFRFLSLPIGQFAGGFGGGFNQRPQADARATLTNPTGPAN
ncbi:Soluble ligand binding domain protein [Isosphaera pallida ATCC 43644]|uniref:Soluble ligand binding domain protein n=1 Tax=Isosphaera pallida (strain ATCC 43644 / DSM 9630 / IS1B) TaxID=575540 RepID=E8QWD1_ISOPI|nr:Soluble ligand binding domain protein [Isosphaera pallida ATCC 43644]